MQKITIQGMKNGHKSSMGLTYAEYAHQLPENYRYQLDFIKPLEKQTYTRRGKVYNVLAVKAQENERVVSIEMIVE